MSNASFKKAQGAPSKGYKKYYTRTVMSDSDIEIYLAAHPEINASDLFRAAVKSIMPRDQLTMRLKDVESRINDKKNELAVLELQKSSLEKQIDESKTMELEVLLEEDCGVWYLHDLIKKKEIRVGGFPDKNDKTKFIKYGDFSKAGKYGIVFDQEKLIEKSRINGFSMIVEDMDFYRQFNPRIRYSEDKEKVKFRMKPEYVAKLRKERKEGKRGIMEPESEANA